MLNVWLCHLCNKWVKLGNMFNSWYNNNNCRTFANYKNELDHQIRILQGQSLLSRVQNITPDVLPSLCAAWLNECDICLANGIIILRRFTVLRRFIFLITGILPKNFFYLANISSRPRFRNGNQKDQIQK